MRRRRIVEQQRKLFFEVGIAPEPEAAIRRPQRAAPLVRARPEQVRVIEVDAMNPQLAARLARALDHWSRLAEPYRSAAREALNRVASRPELSDDVREIVTRALQA